MKTYLYRVSRSGAPVGTWGGSAEAQVPVLSEPSFSAEVDSGLSPLTVALALPPGSAGEDVQLMNTVETYCVDGPDVTLVHGGWIEGITDEVTPDGGGVSVTVVPYVSQLSRDVFRPATGTDRAQEWVATDVSTILSSIVAASVARTGVLSRVHASSASIQTSGKTVDVQAGMETYLDAIQRAKKLGPGDWYWYVDAAGLFSYRNFDTGNPAHTLTVGRDVVRVTRSRGVADVRNTVEFWDGNDASGYVALERPASVSASQTTYGRRTELMRDSRIDSEAAATSAADLFIRERQEPSDVLTVEVLDDGRTDGRGYPLETLHPGDTCVVRNLPMVDGTVFSVTRVDYAPDRATLTLGVGPVRRLRTLGMTVQEIVDFQRITTDGSIPTTNSA